MNPRTVVIGIGNRMDDRALGRFADFNPTAKIVHIDIDAAEHGKNINTIAPILGDAKRVLQALTPEVSQNTHTEWLRWIDDMRAEHSHSMAIPSGPELSVQYVCNRISELAQRQLILQSILEHARRMADIDKSMLVLPCPEGAAALFVEKANRAGTLRQ